VPDLPFAYRKKPPEVAVRLLGGSQFGYVGVAQLHQLGFSDAAITRRVQAGRWVRAHRGVILVGHATSDYRGRAWAAQLAYGSAAVVSHQAAGTLWEIVRYDGPVHLTLPRRRRPRPGIVAHESRSLVAEQVRIHYGLRITNPIRTLVDLADTFTTDQLERALSEAHRLGYVDRHATDFGRHPGRRGLVHVLRRGARMTRSQIERRFLNALRAAGDIPLPLANERLHGYEADFYWPQFALVVEIDAYATHGDRLSFERDRRKQTAYALAGIALVRITEETLPAAVATVRRLISDRTGRL